MKKIIAAMLSLALISSVTPAFAVTDWMPVAPDNPADFNPATDSMGRNGINHFLIDEPGGNNPSLVFYRTDAGKLSSCPEATKALDCGTGKKGEIQGSVKLPICGSIIESCIEKVWVYKKGEPAKQATFKKTLESWTFKGIPSTGLPNGSAVSIWESDLQHTGGNGNYAVSALLTFHASAKYGIDINGLDLNISPVNEFTDPQAAIGEPNVCLAPDGVSDNACGSTVVYGDSGRCAYLQVGVCARAQVPAENSRFGIQLILHNEVTGWFRGRVSDPNISVSKVNSRYNRVTIHGNTVEIPKLLVTLNSKLGDPDLKTLFPNKTYGAQAFMGAESTNAATIQMIDAVRTKANDTASGISSIWSLSTVNARTAANNTASKCLEDDSRLVGVVTTNAMAYVGTAPKWSNGYLSYDVAGMHYLPNGSPATGTYDLVMRSDVARCLYKFSNAQLSASVSVVNEKGTKTTATTVVSEKNGWLKMAAYGFTFSKKTIKIKITKKKKK